MNERRKDTVEPSNDVLAVESVLQNSRVSFRTRTPVAKLSVSVCFAADHTNTDLSPGSVSSFRRSRGGVVETR